MDCQGDRQHRNTGEEVLIMDIEVVEYLNLVRDINRNKLQYDELQIAYNISRQFWDVFSDRQKKDTHEFLEEKLCPKT